MVIITDLRQAARLVDCSVHVPQHGTTCQAEPSRAAPSRAEPSCAEPSWAEPSPTRPDQSQPDPTRPYPDMPCRAMPYHVIPWHTSQQTQTDHTIQLHYKYDISYYHDTPVIRQFILLHSGLDHSVQCDAIPDDSMTSHTKQRPTRQWHRGKGVLEPNQGS